MISFPHWPRLALLSLLMLGASALAQAQVTSARNGDYIVAIVNQELVTAAELQLRLNQVKEDARRSGSRLPPEEELRHQLLDVLIDERVQITNARDSGQRIDDAELERAVNNVAAQNKLTPEQLRERLSRDGIDYARFRNNVRDQMLVERAREREVQGRIKITDAEIDAYVDKQRSAAGLATEYNIAQILITIPEGASDAVVSQRKAQADAALARVRAGEAFDVVAKQLSEDGNKAKGGEIGMRPADRLPDIFVEAVRSMKPGDVVFSPLRTGAGFHVLKLIERNEPNALSISQTRARHILLRPSAQLSQEAAIKRLQEFKRQIAAGTRTFDQIARENSEDGSAPQGGDLGWSSPGTLVPEFEDAMNALSINGLSEPVVSRFGVHLIQVVDRRKTALDIKQQRDQARSALRETKFEEAYADWLKDLRSRAYIEMREPPQ